jgi:hypothetical protein
MVENLALQPTHIKELVPGNDHYTGFCDACAARARGAWLSCKLSLCPIVWQVKF